MRRFVVLAALIATAEAVESSETAVQRILEKIAQWKESSPSIPFVTAAFAQTLDGKMAAIQNGDLSSNLGISGKESLVLTHALRSMHDAILVGGRTAYIDNPRLTNRLWASNNKSSPRPIVIDTDLKYLQQLGNKCQLVNPIVCCSPEAFQAGYKLSIACELLACKTHPSSGRLDLSDVLHQLNSRYGIRSIMVEGGPTLISSLLDVNLIDAVCITVAPRFLGLGIGISRALKLPAPSKFLMGDDIAVLSKL